MQITRVRAPVMHRLGRFYQPFQQIIRQFRAESSGQHIDVASYVQRDDYRHEIHVQIFCIREMTNRLQIQFDRFETETIYSGNTPAHRLKQNCYFLLFFV